MSPRASGSGIKVPWDRDGSASSRRGPWQAGGPPDDASRTDVEQIIRTYFDARDELEPVSREVLLERLEHGEIAVLDVRPPEEFAAGHIPGAVSIPAPELERPIGELPSGVEIVAYCRGPYCVLAPEALATLRGHGHPARQLEDGFPEWRLAGLPVEVG